MKGINILLSGLAIAGLGTTVYSLSQQTKVQQHMNHTMTVIDQSIVATEHVTQQTTRVLSPLTATTTALAGIETQEQQTVADLASMNIHLGHINENEQGIVNTLGTLNQSTRGASTQLTAIASINHALLSASTTAADQAATEAGQVGNLNTMTATSIAQMSKLNHKLSALKAVP